MKRTYQLNLRLSEEERKMYNKIAAHYGLNIQDVMRMIMKREFDQLWSKAIIFMEEKSQ